MTRVDVGVCTFRRPSLAETLVSLAKQALPQGCTLRVIIADNDETPSAEALVRRVAAEHGLAVAYVHAPARNISIARNACLAAADAEWFAFIDDDEIAAPDWIARLLAEAERGGWDAVLGPVKALYSDEAPRWLASGDFHSTRPVEVGGRILKGYSCNVLMRTRAIAERGLTFRLELGRQGGEDDDFFYRLTDAGGTIGYAPDAWTYEPVPPNRARLGWLLERSFRTGQTHADRLAQRHRGPARLAQTGLAAAKGGACLAGAAATAWSARQRCRWLVRGALHAGAVARLAGMPVLQLY